MKWLRCFPGTNFNSRVGIHHIRHRHRGNSQQIHGSPRRSSKRCPGCTHCKSRHNCKAGSPPHMFGMTPLRHTPGSRIPRPPQRPRRNSLLCSPRSLRIARKFHHHIRSCIHRSLPDMTCRFHRTRIVRCHSPLHRWCTGCMHPHSNSLPRGNRGHKSIRSVPRHHRGFHRNSQGVG